MRVAVGSPSVPGDNRGARRARPEAARHPHRGRVRQRDPRAARDLRLDERRADLIAVRGARRRRPAAAALRRAVEVHAVARQPEAGRQPPDGGLLLRRGLPAVMAQLADLLDLDAITVSGQTVGENIAGAEIRRFDRDRDRSGAVAGARQPRRADRIAVPGRRRTEDLRRRPEAPSARREGARLRGRPRSRRARRRSALDVDGDTVMVLRNAGPVGVPGMPEWGHLPIPAKLLKAGVTDLLRISDARMSGTSYGAVVLHVAPESAVGGPLALVQDGDRIRLDVDARTLDLLVDEAELARRRAAWTPPAPKDERGYRRLYVDHVCRRTRAATSTSCADARPSSWTPSRISSPCRPSGSLQWRLPVKRPGGFECLSRRLSSQTRSPTAPATAARTPSASSRRWSKSCWTRSRTQRR